MSEDVLGGEFRRDTNVINNAMSKVKKKGGELALVTITVEKKEGGWLGRIVAGKGGMFNKSKKEFTSGSLDALMSQLSLAAKKGFGLAPRGNGYEPTYQQTPYPPQQSPPQQYQRAPEYQPNPPPTQQPGFSQQVIGSKQCKSCNAYSPETANHCLNCGAKLETPPPKPTQKFCLECGNQVTGAKFCGSCGTKTA